VDIPYKSITSPSKEGPECFLTDPDFSRSKSYPRKTINALDGVDDGGTKMAPGSRAPTGIPMQIHHEIPQ
jgi:hypothetical protein